LKRARRSLFSPVEALFPVIPTGSFCPPVRGKSDSPEASDRMLQRWLWTVLFSARRVFTSLLLYFFPLSFHSLTP
jgi:hypothetical protein